MKRTCARCGRDIDPFNLFITVDKYGHCYCSDDCTRFPCLVCQKVFRKPDGVRDSIHRWYCSYTCLMAGQKIFPIPHIGEYDE